MWWWTVALGGLRAGGGVKHEAVQHCGGVVWAVQARILPMGAKTPISSSHVPAVPVLCVRCAHTPPIVVPYIGQKTHTDRQKEYNDVYSF